MSLNKQKTNSAGKAIHLGPDKEIIKMKFYK
jgi:hypothetical protein